MKLRTKILFTLVGLTTTFLLMFAFVAHYDTETILRVYIKEEQVPNIFFPDQMVNNDIYDPTFTPDEN